jgi:hypothetical protein
MDPYMKIRHSMNINAIAILALAIFSPISSADQPKNSNVINLAGSNTLPELNLSQYKFKKKKISFTMGLQEIISGMPACPTHLGGTTTGIGRATELGVISLVANDCITPQPNYFLSKGKFTLTTANGDNITANYSGSFIPTNYPSIYSYEDFTIQITGGTGRFAGATGSGVLEGTSNIQTGLGEAEGTLLISYGAKDRNNKDENDED